MPEIQRWQVELQWQCSNITANLQTTPIAQMAPQVGVNSSRIKSLVSALCINREILCTIARTFHVRELVIIKEVEFSFCYSFLTELFE